MKGLATEAGVSRQLVYDHFGINLSEQKRSLVIGRLQKVLGPGINFIVPFLDRVRHKISILERQLPTATQDAITKDNVLLVDGREVRRWRPWRDDCRRFREVNPYCRRWSDGSWSSDYSRSGWCPGDWVPPTRFELSRALTPGTHTLQLLLGDHTHTPHEPPVISQRITITVP